jgi:unsaturated chondroitin disaccharide hydrolase
MRRSAGTPNRKNSMMRNIVITIILIGLVRLGYSQNTKKIYAQAEQQINLLHEEALKNRSGRLIFPRTVAKDSAKLIASGDWTSGFFPGILWMLFERTGNPEWQSRAEAFTALMDREPRNRSSHDVGFKVYDSYGQGYRLTNKEEYKKAILDGAATLITRFNKKVGCIRSWDFGKWQYPVIIDNMMNLELLFAAARLSGDSIYYKVAVAHANTTMKNHFRPDYSSYHVVDYDTLTGKMISGGTHQGYADGSAWARGQAWALYGYTMCYRETKDPAYLQQAENVAAFLLSHPTLPADKIPYWDFNVADTSKEPRDASAAAIIASALYELKGFSKNKKTYVKAADKIMLSLTKYYRAPVNSNHGFILLHSTGHKPVNGEVDVPLIYADYYYLEALKRSGR